LATGARASDRLDQARVIISHIADPRAHRPARHFRRQGGSFDDFVGTGEDQRRDRQAKFLGGLKVDDQLKGGRLLDRQIGRIDPLAVVATGVTL
jgi:hypothetical protein